jgi:mRNA interferase RelE/StbE
LAWTLEFSKAALSSLKKMDRHIAARIVDYLEDRVATSKSPRDLGSAMVGKKYENQWRYRIGDYRVLAEIKEEVVTILVVEIGHRREIYR